jgi:ABC-type lipoprotein export system ATPase subunit
VLEILQRNHGVVLQQHWLLDQLQQAHGVLIAQDIRELWEQANAREQRILAANIRNIKTPSQGVFFCGEHGII